MITSILQSQCVGSLCVLMRTLKVSLIFLSFFSIAQNKIIIVITLTVNGFLSGIGSKLDK